MWALVLVKIRKWFVGRGIQFSKIQPHSRNDFSGIKKMLQYDDASTMAFGGYFVPDHTGLFQIILVESRIEPEYAIM